MKTHLLVPMLVAATVLLPLRAARAADDVLTVYSGRSEELVAPIIEQFKKESGLDVKVRYGQTAEMAATILEEGANSPADVFFAQDAGALGALVHEHRLGELPEDLLSQVPPRFRSPQGRWIGTSARLRVLVYNSQKLSEADLPDDIYGFCDPKWKGRIGWAPANGSFQAFVTALRLVDGEQRAREWLQCIQSNAPSVYPKNMPIVAAVGAGEIDVGFVNHYYLLKMQNEQGPQFPAKNYIFRKGGPGALINVAGVGIVDTAKHKDAALKLIHFFLSPEAQKYFASDDYEYPLAGNVETDPRLVPLDKIPSPNVELGHLDDLQGTLKLLQDLGIL